MKFVLPLHELEPDLFRNAVNESDAQPQKETEMADKVRPTMSSDPDDWFRPYDRNSPTSIALRDYSVSVGKATRENYKAAYPCYKMADAKQESYVYYEAGMERLVLVYKPDTVKGPDGEERPNNLFYMIFGEAQPGGANPADTGLSKVPALARAGYHDLYLEWLNAGARDQETSNERRTGGEIGSKKITQLGGPLKAVMIMAVRAMRKATGGEIKAGTPLPIFTSASDKEKFQMGGKASTAHTETETRGEHMRKLGPRGYMQWYNAHIGKTSKIGGSGRADILKDMLLGMGLGSEKYLERYDNLELMRLFNALVQLNPKVDPRYKTIWRENMANLLQEYSAITEDDVKNDPYGDFLYDESVVKGVSMSDPRIRKDLRTKLFAIIDNIILKAEKPGKTSWSSSKKPGDPENVKVARFVHPKERRMGFESLMQVPSFTQFLTEGWTDDIESQREKRKEILSKKQVAKTTKWSDVESKVAKKIKRGTYHVADAERGTIDGVLFDALATIGAYIDVRFTDTGIRQTVVPAKEYYDQYIPEFAKEYYVISVPGGYYSYMGGHDKTANVMDRRHIEMFDTQESAEEKIEEISEYGMSPAVAIRYDEAIRKYYDERLNRALKDYTADPGMNRVFYLNPADKKRASDRSVDDLNVDADDLISKLYDAISLKSETESASGKVKSDRIARRKAMAKSGDYSDFGETDSEMAADFKSFGTDPETLYSSTPADYLVKTAEIINKMSEHGINETAIRLFVDKWYELADMAAELTGESIEKSTPGLTIPGEDLKFVKENMSNGEDQHDDRIRYLLTMAFLQMFVRDLGSAYIDLSGMSREDDDANADDMSGLSLYDVWESYMNVIVNEEKNAESEGARKMIYDLRGRLIELAVEAMKRADFPEKDKQEYADKIEEFSTADAQADMLRDRPGSYAESDYAIAKRIMKMVNDDVAGEYKNKIRQAVTDFYGEAKAQGGIISPEALIDLIKAPRGRRG